MDKQQLTNLIEAVVADETSADLYKLVDSLGLDSDNEEFCDHYELGNWFLGAMDLNDVSAIIEVSDIAYRRLKEEHEDREEAKLALEVERGQ